MAGGIVKGSFKVLTIAGKALTVSQSVGLLLGTAAVTNFAAGVAGYAMHTAGSETESFNILKGISEGIGQTGKGVLSFVLYCWNVCLFWSMESWSWCKKYFFINFRKSRR